jgi:hypothetical protein
MRGDLLMILDILVSAWIRMLRAADEARTPAPAWEADGTLYRMRKVAGALRGTAR